MLGEFSGRKGGGWTRLEKYEAVESRDEQV
jgi:hypothetical protein